MGYRIMQLQKEIMGRKYEVIQGIPLGLKPKNFEFASLDAIGEGQRATIQIRDYSVKDFSDGYKKISLFLPEKDEAVEEEGILLIVEYIPQIKYSGKKIAGRYSEEGIFLLKSGDTIKIERNLVTEEYFATQHENQMYLVEKYAR